MYQQGQFNNSFSQFQYNPMMNNNGYYNSGYYNNGYFMNNSGYQYSGFVNNQFFDGRMMATYSFNSFNNGDC